MEHCEHPCGVQQRYTQAEPDRQAEQDGQESEPHPQKQEQHCRDLLVQFAG
ncbi:hypothetical protein BACCAP_01800 [Pseudoflavonifractor capillosus ATCC 29799]|uniref:Uncharacterized protein n=1 Tax=Pseudoflavonifractor capillosus ATCC 29799 TaxID=411467 RepID=A6NUB9_9FIRM|nr:hypothetical protein BACCAP_01800 [Pseudoflavonifractor capillosus ATCC 29799]